jgi:hypothetical protein
LASSINRKKALLLTTVAFKQFKEDILIYAMEYPINTPLLIVEAVRFIAELVKLDFYIFMSGLNYPILDKFIRKMEILSI